MQILIEQGYAFEPKVGAFQVIAIGPRIFANEPRNFVHLTVGTVLRKLESDNEFFSRRERFYLPSCIANQKFQGFPDRDIVIHNEYCR